MSGCSELDKAVVRLGLCEDPTSVAARELSEWRPGGAETYIYLFELDCGDGTRKLLLKALVPHPASSTVQEAVNWRSERCELLRAMASPTVKIFATHQGTLLEEYVPHPILESLSAHPLGPIVPPKESLLTGAAEPGWQIAFDVLYLAAVVDHLRFAPLSLFDDLRSDGHRAIVVDLGQDLGPPLIAEAGDVTRREAEEWLRSHTNGLSESSLASLWSFVHEKLEASVSSDR